MSALFLISIASFAFLSSSACVSASRCIFSTSSFESPELPVMEIFCSLPVPRSFAETCRMPFASMSKVTSICGTPRGAGGIPSRWNLPSVLLSRAIGRSPWSTCTSTLVCPSAAVLNTSDFFVGIVVLRWISCVATPPSVSLERVSGEEREIDLGLHRAGELDLRLLGRLLQALEDHLVLAHVDAGLGAELLDQPVHDLLIHVVAAEVRVAVGGDHLDHVLADLQDGDVERAAAVVEYGHDLVLLLVQSVGQRGSRGLVDDAPHFQPGDAPGILGRLALGVVEVRGHGDDRLAHGLAEVVLGRTLQLLQDLRADLRGAPLLSLDLHHGVAVVRLDDLERNPPSLVGSLLELAAHEALDGVDGVLRIGDRLPAGDLADQDLSVLAEADDGRGEPVALLVLDHLRVAPLHDRDHGVRRAQVDSDDLDRK